MMPFNLWPDTPPQSLGSEKEDRPTLAVYPAPFPNGSAIIICPGGGYGCLADHECNPIAVWLNSLGIMGIVLRYRHGPRYHHPVPLMDAARAVRTTRHRATSWGIDPKRIGILGFSAGGHLAATLATRFTTGDSSNADPLEHQSSRPDLAILLYPVITMADPFAHARSREHLLGKDAADEQINLLSNERHVSQQTPPTFIFHTADDPAVPVENALQFATALRSHRIPFELHVYESGSHGVGLAQNYPALKSWPTLCASWLGNRHFGDGTDTLKAV